MKKQSINFEKGSDHLEKDKSIEIFIELSWKTFTPSM